ncbi:imidazolonepropionase-like domain-containing protein, partial [Streptomyces sp. NPDC055078]
MDPPGSAEATGPVRIVRRPARPHHGRVPGTAGTGREVTALAVLGEWIVATGTTAELRSRFPGDDHPRPRTEG